MQIFNSTSNQNTFKYNGLTYPKNFMCLRQGSTNVAVHNGYDTRQQLMGSYHYSEIQVNGVVYTSQGDVMAALASLIFAKSFNYVVQDINATRLISIGDITVDTNYITVEPAEWIINGIDFETTSNTVLTVPFAATGYKRIDILIGNSASQIQRISGNETTGIAIAPITPIDSVYITQLNVNDNSIVNPIPPITGSIYVQKEEFSEISINDTGTISLSLTGDISAFRLIDGSVDVINGFDGNFYFNNTAIYYGKEIKIANVQSNEVILKHNQGGVDYSMIFPDGNDLTIQPNEVVIFKIVKSTSVYAEFISLNRVSSGSTQNFQQVLDTGNVSVNTGAAFVSGDGNYANQITHTALSFYDFATPNKNNAIEYQAGGILFKDNNSTSATFLKSDLLGGIFESPSTAIIPALLTDRYIPFNVNGVYADSGGTITLSGTSHNLQQVTDIGNTTSNEIISQSIVGGPDGNFYSKLLPNASLEMYSPDNLNLVNINSNNITVNGIIYNYPNGATSRLATLLDIASIVDTTVTGGTYSAGTASFRNNTGGTFLVSGFTSPFTGGTLSGATKFIDGLTANSISATTYFGIPTDETKLSEQDIIIFCDFTTQPNTSQFSYYDGFIINRNGSGFAISNANTPVIDVNNLGVWRLQTGGGAQNYTMLGSGQDNTTLNQFSLTLSVSSYESFINLESIPTGSTNAYYFISGFVDQMAAVQTNGCFFTFANVYADNVNTASPNWQCVTINGGVRTVTTTSVLGSTAWVKLKVEATSTSVLYYIDNILVATHTTNIPTVRMGYNTYMMNRNSGIANAFYIDYFRAKFKNRR